MGRARKVKILGERNTGTRYLEQLVACNLSVELLRGGVPWPILRVFGPNEAVRDLYFRLTYRRNLGWKHAMAPSAARLQALDRAEVVFLTLTKNPYAWLLSLYRRPYHQPQMPETLAAFVRSPWHTVAREGHREAFRSPVVLWNEKNRGYLALGSGVCVRNLRYEDLVRDPETVVSEIAAQFALPRRQPQFVNVTNSTKQEAQKSFDDYQAYYLEERWRDKLDPEVVALINADLDEELMRRFGYEVLR
jgi:hypothetical protein